jgi:hypothetical protein
MGAISSNHESGDCRSTVDFADMSIEGIWEIVPYTRVGPLRFGEPRSEVRGRFGPPSKVFKKVPFADNDTDAFDQVCIHAYYDLTDLLESIDAWGASLIQFDGLPLLGAKVDEITAELARRGYSHCDYLFERAGFSLYVIDGDVRGVSVFARGYFDTSDPNSAVNRAQRAAEAWRRERYGI